MNKEQELIQKITYHIVSTANSGTTIDEKTLQEWLKEYAKAEKIKLIWEMIEGWQDARDHTDDEYLSKERFSFKDIEHDLYGELEKIQPIPEQNQ